MMILMDISLLKDLKFRLISLKNLCIKFVFGESAVISFAYLYIYRVSKFHDNLQSNTFDC